MIATKSPHDVLAQVLYLSGEPDVEFEYWLPKNRGTFAQLVAITHTLPPDEGIYTARHPAGGIPSVQMALRCWCCNY